MWCSVGLYVEQGIRAVIHTHSGGHGISGHKPRTNEQLTSPYWKNVCRTLLPVHRAISGLHYHGSETRLVNALEALASCGANMSAVDNTGNSPVHKALQVCTSNSVVGVVDKLLKKGCSAVSKNMEQDTPLHMECKRYGAL